MGDIADEVDAHQTEELIDDFSSLTIPEEAGIPDIQEKLSVLNEKILTWDIDQATIHGKREEAYVFLEYAKEVQQLEEILQTVKFTNEEDAQNDLLNCAQSILQTATVSLVEEFTALLREYHQELGHHIQHQQNLEFDSMIVRAPTDENVDDFSINSFGDEPAGGSHSSINSEQEDTAINLIHPSILSLLKNIATFLFQCNYGAECCQAYICARKVALDDCLLVLGMETFGTEEVLKMGWNELNRIINSWKHAMKVFIKLYLASDRRLCELIFEDLPRSIGESCFIDASKSSVFHLFTFAEAVAISAAKPEKLFQILDMYEVLDGFLVYIESFFSEDCGLSILDEYHHVLSRLSDSIKTNMNVFKWQIQTSKSTTAFPRAGVHHLTKYVMNYIKALATYGETINLILNNQPDSQYLASENPEERKSELLCCPFAQYILSVNLLLESNLDDKSHLYNNDAMLNVFMMNNICYMVQKVKNTDLRCFVADEWIRTHIGKFQKHARDYQRASWTSVINFLMEDGYQNSGSPSKKVLKQRFEGFNLAFEEIYKTQTGWLVPDAQLREDLRISISPMVQAYRVFFGRYADILEGERHKEKYIKYSADDLESYLLDLFEGSDKSLHYPRRRSFVYPTT